MKNLAPDITRKRLLVEAKYGIDVSESSIREYFKGLTDNLGLRTYGDPTTGVEPFRETEVNIESAKASKQREIEDQLAKILQEKGIVKEFSKYYIPKGTEGGSKFINPF